MDELNFGLQKWDYERIDDDIIKFMPVYQKRPIADNRGGMTFVHLFWAWWTVKKLKPKNIIESGVYKGQGTWVFRQALPDVRIFSIDPDLDQREWIDEKAEYFTEDFSMINWSQRLDPEETLCFFDDHQNAYHRLMQMKWMGFKIAMFEDNYPARQGDCYSIKKILTGKGFKGCTQRSFSEKVLRKVMNKASSENEIKPNQCHSFYVHQNIKTYTTLPPLYKTELTRWGDAWEDEEYLTGKSVASEKVLNEFPVIMEEAKGYNWICFVELNL